MDGNWKTLPLVNFGKKNYNNNASNNAGEPQREGVGECADADNLKFLERKAIIDVIIKYSEDQNKVVIRLYDLISQILKE